MKSFETNVAESIDVVEPKVRAALGEQGFGVLTEMGIAATLRAKIGVERAPLKILGACNPTFAHRALELDPSVALLLPCNVVLEATDAGTHVAIIAPRALMDAPKFAALAEEAATSLQVALETVARG